MRTSRPRSRAARELLQCSSVSSSTRCAGSYDCVFSTSSPPAKTFRPLEVSNACGPAAVSLKGRWRNLFAERPPLLRSHARPSSRFYTRGGGGADPGDRREYGDLFGG